MIKKVFVLAAAAVLLVLSSAQVNSAPAFLRVVPVSGTAIDLDWKAVEGERYDIWATTNGTNWSKIYTTGPGEDSFTVTEGIQPYRNYYFLVAAAGAVGNPLTDAGAANSTEIGVAYPPNQHVHNYYQADTNLCSNCHQPHNAQGAGLLSRPTVEDTCLTCHDGTQSKYNVLEGEVSRDGTWNNPLESPAGAFGSAFGKTAATTPTTVHTLGTPLNNAPGGNLGGGEEWEKRLSCVSCHAAHFSSNYRILTLNTPDSKNIQVTAFAETSPSQQKESINYIQGVTELCSGCHADFHAEKGAGSKAAAGTYQNDDMFRHPVGVSLADYDGGLTTSLPLEGKYGDNRDKITCLTCHKAHGSTALGYSKQSKAQEPIYTNNLLRRDYFGVCQDCHQK